MKTLIASLTRKWHWIMRRDGLPDRPQKLDIVSMLVGCLIFLGSMSIAMAEEKTAVTSSEDATRISLQATIPAGREKVPSFVKITLHETVIVSARDASARANISISAIQGETDKVALQIAGPGNVDSVTGTGVLDWAVRQDARGGRILEIRTEKPLAKGASLSCQVTFAPVKSDAPAIPFEIPTLSAEDGGTFSGYVQLQIVPSANVKIVSHAGLIPVVAVDGAGNAAPAPQGARHYAFRHDGKVSLRLTTGAAEDLAILEKFSLKGEYQPRDRFSFILSATARVQADGAVLPVLGGGAALREFPDAKGFRVQVDNSGDSPVYSLVFDKAGEYPVALKFDARISRSDDRQSVRFAIPCVQIAPFSLSGFAGDIQFSSSSMPAFVHEKEQISGFLPADGEMAFSWREAKADTDARLFFSTEEITRITVRPGLLNQSNQFTYKMLQGKIDILKFTLKGEGEILRVTGADVLSWNVSEMDLQGTADEAKLGLASRVLTVRLAQPKTGAYSLAVDAQTPLENFPVKTSMLLIAPMDGVHHGGFVQVANEGSVRIETTPLRSLTQVSPSLFPGDDRDPNTQRFVYRVANADAGMEIQADSIMPETSLSMLAIYKVGESDLFIDVDLELDVREAPLSSFRMQIPESYSVSPAEQSNEWQYTLKNPVAGKRELSINFNKPFLGRSLVHFRLEKPREADMALWSLEPILFPEAKSVRGHIGVVASPGLRISPEKSSGVVEIATAFFPTKTEGLQQAFRLRETAWSASMKVEKLDLSVLSDGLHLFAVREGMVSASTTINYVIVGAPVGAFRFEVPEDVRNLEFAGRDIRSWKREKNIVEVSLHKPAGGAYTLLGTYDMPLDPRGGVVGLAGLRPLDVQSEQGFVLVTSELQFNVSEKAASKNLVTVEPSEIPAEYRMMFDAPLLAAYQYADRPYDLQLGLVPRSRGEPVSQVVDFASLQTRLSRDGQIVTEARYVVKSHGHPHLRVSVPEGLKLWTARVNNTEVLPVVDKAATLIPLPPGSDANAIATVDLRFAGAVENMAKVHLVAPKIEAPVIKTNWQVTPDEGVSLGFAKGNLAQENPPKRSNALDMLEKLISQERRSGFAFCLSIALVCVAAVVFLLARKIGQGGHVFVGRLIGTLGLILSIIPLLVFAMFLFSHPRLYTGDVTSNALNFTAPINLSNGELFLELGKVSSAGISWLGIALLAVFAACGFAFAVKKESILLRAITWAVCGTMVLAFTSNLSLFSLVAAAFIVVEIVIPGLRCFRPVKPSAAVAMVCCLLAIGAVSDTASAREVAQRPVKVMPVAQNEIAARTAESITQKIAIFENYTEASGTIRISGKIGDRFDLLSEPAVLTKCEPPSGVRLARVSRNGVVIIQLVLEKETGASVDFSYKMAVGTQSRQLSLPTGMAATDVVQISTETSDIQFVSDEAVSMSAPAGVSVTEMIFQPVAARTIRWAAKERDRGSEKLLFYAENAEVFVPSLGVLDGYHRIKIRPAQGLLSELNVTIPEGLSVANVQGANVGRWRFDPEQKRLSIRIEPAQGSEIALMVQTQKGMNALPQKIVMAPLHVEGAAGQIGMLAIGTGEEVQILGTASAEKLSRATASRDFPLSDFQFGQMGVVFTIRDNYRYNSTDARLVTVVSEVEPDVRVTANQSVSLGEDRIVLNANLIADITRSGIFRLSFPLPEGMDVESLSGAALSHWTEVNEKGQRVVMMHLRGRTLGRQQFSLSLTGQGLGRNNKWVAPRIAIREAFRQNGSLAIVPEEGLRLHVTQRDDVTQIDPGRGAGIPKGALAFRILQRDWKLAFDIENLAPWVQCSFLQDISIRDGQVRGVVNFEYTIENAATKALKVQLPADAGSVRFSGDLVADAIPVPEQPGLWEVKLQRRVIGRTVIQATFQRPTANGATEMIGAVNAVDAGLQHGWLSLRTSGRLELKLGALPAALTTTDWQSVPASLRQGASEPVTVLRMVENKFDLPVSVSTHDPAKLLAIRVEKADLQTMLSDDGVMLTRVNLATRLSEKGLLRVTLPAEAIYWHGFVNNEPVRVAVDGKTLLVPLVPNPVSNQPTEVEFYYSDSTSGGSLKHKLAGPKFDVPLENITWQVQLPSGRVLEKHRGNLQLIEQEDGWRMSGKTGKAELKSVADYQSYNQGMIDEKGVKADKLIQLGNKLRSQGDQEKARQALSLASTLSKGNAALNEDARVQLNALRMEQIEVGMNRRKNWVNANVGNNVNIMNDMTNAGQIITTGELQTNYAPTEVAQQRQLNTAEDNTVIRRVAERMLAQQQSMAGTLDSIRTTIPDGDKTLVFTKSLQVSTDSDLSVEVSLGTPDKRSNWPLLILGVMIFAAALVLPRLVGRKAA